MWLCSSNGLVKSKGRASETLDSVLLLGVSSSYGKEEREEEREEEKGENRV